MGDNANRRNQLLHQLLQQQPPSTDDTFIIGHQRNRQFSGDQSQHPFDLPATSSSGYPACATSRGSNVVMPDAMALSTQPNATNTATPMEEPPFNSAAGGTKPSMMMMQSRSATTNDQTSNLVGPCTSTNPGTATSVPPVSHAGPLSQSYVDPKQQQIACAACNGKIIDKYLLEAIGKYWHEDCLRCVACHCRLGEVGSTLYVKQNMLLCRRDYLRLFGLTGVCAACHKNIPAFEMVMRARNNVYHLECFACQECNHRFCVGDQFYLCDNKVLCQYDYNERMVFAQMFNNNYNNLAQLKEHINKQVDGLDDLNAG